MGIEGKKMNKKPTLSKSPPRDTVARMVAFGLHYRPALLRASEKVGALQKEQGYSLILFA